MLQHTKLKIGLVFMYISSSIEVKKDIIFKIFRMDNLVPEGNEVLKLLKISERGSNQLRYQNRLFGLKNPSKNLWRCITST